MQGLVPNKDKKQRKEENEELYESRFFTDYDVTDLLGAVSLICYIFSLKMLNLINNFIKNKQNLIFICFIYFYFYWMLDSLNDLFCC